MTGYKLADDHPDAVKNLAELRAQNARREERIKALRAQQMAETKAQIKAAAAAEKARKQNALPPVRLQLKTKDRNTLRQSALGNEPDSDHSDGDRPQQQRQKKTFQDIRREVESDSAATIIW